MNATRLIVLCLLLLPAVPSLAQHAKIDPKAFAPPKSIVLVDLPHMVPSAHIGVLTMYMPGNYQHHFTERVDRFFDVASKEAGSGDVAKSAVTNTGAASGQGLIADMLFAKAAETQRRAAGFEAEILKRYPDYDLRVSFLKALIERLQANGVAVKLAEEGQNGQPRLRWPAQDANGKGWPAGALESAPAVDADLLVQLCPVAFYSAPGGFNAYRRSVTVAVAVYDGRTKKFYGRQTMRFVPPDSRFEYSKYDSLVEDLKEAAPALRDALVSLAVPLADIVSGKAPPE
jgi:hypothetical protein